MATRHLFPAGADRVIEYRDGLPPMVVLFNDMGHLPQDLRWTGFPPSALP